MIACVSGVLAEREGDTIVVQTDGGVGYSITVPAGVAERLPPTGGRISLHTELVVKEDGWSLFGFDRPAERFVFQRLLGASGFGPKLAIALLSALGPERTVRSILSRRSGCPELGRGHRSQESRASRARVAGPLWRVDLRVSRSSSRWNRGCGAGARRARVRTSRGGRCRPGGPRRRRGARDSATHPAGVAAARLRPGRTLSP